jgi:helix-turn-helix protein
MSLADRLRNLAERLPPGGSLTLTRDGLLQLADVTDDPLDQTAVSADFTIADLAARFQRSPSTIRGWCERSCFDGAFKLNGRDWRIPRESVETFLNKQRGDRPAPDLGAWRAVRARMSRRGQL